jgi:hypothetical protein
MSEQNTSQPLQKSYSVHSNTLSNCVYSLQPSSSVVVRKEAAKTLRQTYEEVFDEYEKLLKNDDEIKITSEWWIKQFRDSGDLLVKKFKESVDDQEKSEQELKPVIIGYGDKLFEFDPTNKSTIMVGRKDGCDILFSSVSGCSRMHAIIYFIPELNKIVVADMGSLMGIKTIQRSNTNKVVEHSTMINRKLIIFDYDESAILECGEQIVTISPKECIICMNRQRDCRLACGHFVTCKGCADKIPHNRCCVCRQAIHTILPAIYALNSSPVVILPQQQQPPIQNLPPIPNLPPLRNLQPVPLFLLNGEEISISNTVSDEVLDTR